MLLCGKGHEYIMVRWVSAFLFGLFSIAIFVVASLSLFRPMQWDYATKGGVRLLIRIFEGKAIIALLEPKTREGKTLIGLLPPEALIPVHGNGFRLTWRGQAIRVPGRVGLPVSACLESLVVFPLWVPFVLFAIYPSVALITGPFQCYEWRRRGRCIQCGYSLIGNTSGRCPECGTPLESSPSTDAENAET